MLGQEESRQLAHTGQLAAVEGSADLRANRQRLALMSLRGLIIQSSWTSLHLWGFCGITLQRSSRSLIYPTESRRALQCTCVTHDLC